MNRWGMALGGAVSLLLFFTGAGTDRAAERLCYYSDYFSFVGKDSDGRVAFALDNNRGQDGEAFQAEHFTVLHDERAGWQTLQGSGPYPNPAGALQTIPDSEFFRFRGSPNSGLSIESPRNNLTLQVEPIVTHLARERGADHYRLGSAPAALRWKGRILRGRVIYEFLSQENWNRLTRTYFGYWNSFHGLYLLTEDTATGAVGDFYLHSQKSAKSASLSGFVDGFTGSGDGYRRLAGAEISVREKEWALGFYRWPVVWSGHLGPAGHVEMEFSLRLSDRKTFGNWLIGGFSMGIVKGTVTRDGKRFEACGLGEMIQ